MGTLIILVLLVLGGIYFMNVERTSVTEEDQLPLILGNDDAEGLPPTSSSDDVSAIESDVTATDLDALEAQIDADLEAIDSSL